MFVNRSNASRHSWRRATALSLAAASLCAAPAYSGTQAFVPKGIPAGPWVVAPYFAATVGADSNIFRSNVDPRAETISTLTAGVVARVPVRNSLLELLYEARKLDYQNFAPSRSVEQLAGINFNFNFSTGDSLVINETYNKGISDVRSIDAGGELEFEDAPFTLNRLEAVWSRTNPSAQGFVIRVARVDLNFQNTGQPVPFFDYGGFDAGFEYRQPISPRSWLNVFYESRDYNHYRAATAEEVGVPFRKEEADAITAGTAGVTRRGAPYGFRVGYGKFRLVGTAAEFRGIVGEANGALVVGSRTRLNFTFRRRPLPSNFDTYYIVNALQVSAERAFMREFTIGARIIYTNNRYVDELIDPVTGLAPTDCTETIRKDQRGVLEAYFDWLVHPRIAFRLAAGRQQRISNCESSDFSLSAVTTGIRVGWF